MRGDFELIFNQGMHGKLVKIHFCKSFQVSEKVKYDLAKNIKSIDNVIFCVSCLLEKGTMRVYLKKPYDLLDSCFICLLTDRVREIYKELKPE